MFQRLKDANVSAVLVYLSVHIKSFEIWTVSDLCVTHPIYHSDVASLQCLSHHAAVTDWGKAQGREREQKEERR